MGTPLTANEPGDNCSSCWGLGKAFGDTVTPHIIRVTLSALFQGALGSSSEDQLLITPQLLIQEAAPCQWAILAGGFEWRVNFAVPLTTLIVRRLSDNKRAFVDDAPPPCSLPFPNALETAPDNVAYGGVATITWSLAGL